jgi:hypothetical protein
MYQSLDQKDVQIHVSVCYPGRTNALGHFQDLYVGIDPVLRFLAETRHHSHSAHCNAPYETLDACYGLTSIQRARIREL